MSKRVKIKPACVVCNTQDGLYFEFGNGKKLPSYHIVIGLGIVCNECSDNKNRVNV